MAPEVIEAVENLINKQTEGLHETTRLNKKKIKDIKIDPNDLATLSELGIDTSFLEAFDPNSPACKKAAFIDKTLKDAGDLMLAINTGFTTKIHIDIYYLTWHIMRFFRNSCRCYDVAR